ncbi:Holliday junction resolvase RuvX [Vampirovibrio sp.]|uniref:Holliday junction resolvase RuvX n=1 Tax=Vampirovibrio sp. TaxID=2717857 RepID=UPI003593800D
MSLEEDLLPRRILGIDPGEKRLGLAVSDPFGNFAVGLDTLSNYEGKDLLPELAAICDRYEIREVIIGLPLHMSGEEGISAQKARELGAILTEGLKVEVAFMDERLTSKMAEQSLRDMGIQSSRHRKKGVVDQAAAMRILQDYLDRKAKKAF